MGDKTKPPDNSSSGETDIGACSGHTDREKTDSSPAPGSENGGVDAPYAQRALLRSCYAHQNEQLAAPEYRRAQSMRALTFTNDVSSEPPPSEGAAQVDDVTLDKPPWWERSSGTRHGQPKEEDVCGTSDQDAATAPGTPSDLRVNVRAITDNHFLDDPEFQELLSELAPVQVCQKSSDAISDVTPGCSQSRSAGQRSSVQPQPSRHDLPDELEGLVLDLEELNRTGLPTQTTAEELLRQASETQKERLRRRPILDSLSSSLFTEDDYLCVFCRCEEVQVCILECGHCYSCLDCFKKYIEPVRPPRCLVCKRRSKSYDFR